MAKDTLAGTEIHWTRMGQGRREALLLHCSLAHLGAWRGVATQLSSDLSMLMMDLPGHGQSGDWDPERDYQTQAAEAALALLDTEAQETVDLVGHSFGATVALRVAQMVPERVRSLTLIEPVLFAALSNHPQYAGEYDDVDAFMKGAFADAMRAGDHIEAARLFHGVWGGAVSWERLPVILRDDMAARIHLISACAPVTSMDVHGQAAPGALEGLKMSCLLVEGQGTPRIIAAIHDVFEARLPDARRVVIEGAGHMSPISHPERVASEIRRLLERTPAETTV
ncbi:alpha/beta hydrolase [Aliiroseovarius sp. KMU-50]|uniref:Alpha/beta hydrolase n=1 Tax=Aliiroseovarius salicola TaxID=3009082 RepID=A0ABT4W3V0_9RHOB|nr:alpha/beta hydrolase [Aliiroseovarius sp. KMU-50]MDA5095202.1 alpha/beta hydrolase [Aliiroseovarius sp. KMU-50]